MTYRIISTLDGSITNCSLSELSRNLNLNCVLVELNKDGTPIDSWPLVQNTLIFFAIEFADYALNNYAKKKIPAAKTCIALMRQWLENPDSVTATQMKAASQAANSAAYAATMRVLHQGSPEAANAAVVNATANAAAANVAAANAAANIAADVANAAANFVCDAWSITNVVSVARCAENVAYAAYAAGAGKEVEQHRQGRFIVEYLRTGA